MSFNWSEYLSLAFHLAGVPGITVDPEASKRSAISRSYYFGYCSARNHLIKVDRVTIPKSAKAHREVSDKFRRSSDIARKKVASKLDRLRVDRNKADYEDTVKGLDSLTKKSLADAKAIAGLLSSL